MRTLITNADDFGFTRGVNDGIVDAHLNGILTATTLMANAPAFDHAVALAKQYPSLDVGCHLVLIGGNSLARPDTPLPPTVASMMGAILAGRVEPYRELRLQVQKIIESGIKPTHLDTHKHTHLFPPVLDAVTRLSQEFRIRWVRKPFDAPILKGRPLPVSASWKTRAVSKGIGFMMRDKFDKALAAHNCRATDHFFGFQITGNFHATELIEIVANLPEGATEFMCHPGVFNEELQAAPTRLKESRQWELEALKSPQVRAALTAHNVTLGNYR